MSNVFIAFQNNEESRPVVAAILSDNPDAVASYPTGLVKIDAPDRLTISRASIEEETGGRYDLQQIHVNLVTIAGCIDEDDDRLMLSWNH
jgi:phenol/toluene 2-monooxygenase (NADH) P2/A2